MKEGCRCLEDWKGNRPWAFKDQRQLQGAGGLALPHLVRSMVHRTDPVHLADLRSLGQSYSLLSLTVMHEEDGWSQHG